MGLMEYFSSGLQLNHAVLLEGAGMSDGNKLIRNGATEFLILTGQK